MNLSQAKYLDPKNDLTFRKIFGQHPNIMKSFLNSILPLEENQQIETITYQDPAMLPVLPELKHSIVDVKCTDNFDRQFIVEMRMYWTNSFKNRMLFNAGKAYITQLDKAHKYSELCPVYGLSLVDDVFLKEEKYKTQYYHNYKLSHQELPEETIKGIELIFIELPKFKPQTFTEKKARNLWLRFLTEIDENTKDVAEDLLNEKEIREALEQLQISAFTKEELAYYEKYWDKVRTEKDAIEDARKREQEALKKLDETLAKMKTKDKELETKDKELEKEHQNLLKTAKFLKNMNISNNEISKQTGLSIDEIEKL